MTLKWRSLAEMGRNVVAMILPTNHRNHSADSTRIIAVTCIAWNIAVCYAPQRAVADFHINLVPLSETTHPNLAGYAQELDYDPDNPVVPGFESFVDPDGSKLEAVLEYAKQEWERIFAPNDHTIEITWFWDSDMDLITEDDGTLVQPSTTAQGFAVLDDDGDGLVDYAAIRFNTNRTGWWFDPTPDDDSEFNMSQQLFRDLAASTTTEASWRYPYSDPPNPPAAGQPPELFETAYTGSAPTLSPADGMRDAVTVAMHEMGHALGMAGGHEPLKDEVLDDDLNGDWDFDLDPDKVGGTPVAAYARGNPNNTDPDDSTVDLRPHLAGHHALMGANWDDRRKRPSAVDVLALSVVSGLDQVVLDRTDFLVGSDWNTDGSWEGNRVPSLTVDAFVRYGGNVTLSGDGDAENLLIDEQSSVSTSIHTLHVFDTTTVGGTSAGVSELTVFPLGELQTNVLNINDEGRTRVDFGGLVDASTLNINGNGELLMAGTPSSPAVVDGIIAHVNNGGVLRVNGNAQLDSQLALHSGGVINSQVSGVELRLNGLTGLDGGAMQGPGIVRQNGSAVVTGNTTIDVDTYDMDGTSENTTITINAGRLLTVNSAHINTVAANDFDGTLNVNGGTLHMEHDWTLDGTLNLTKDGSPAVLSGPGRLTVSTLGTVHVTDAGRIDSDLTLAGELSVGSQAVINGDMIITSAAQVQTSNVGDAINLNGTTVIGGGSYSGGGLLRFEGDVQVIGNTTIGMSQTDLDGTNLSGGLSIAQGVTLSVASTTIDPADDDYDDTMNLRGTFSTIVPFELTGTVHMIQQGRGFTPQINGLTGFTIHPSGLVDTDGDAEINRDTVVQGGLHVGQGVTQINASSILFVSTANVTVADGGTLELNGPTAFEGGSHTGLGLIQFNGMTNINDDTTISAAAVDLDGAAENTVLNLNDSQLTLNVDLLDTKSVQYDGLANVVGENARLAVNLNSPTLGWRLMSGGQLNFSNPAPNAPTVTMLSGSALTADGVINAVGPLTLAADVAVRNLLNVNTAASHVHFGGPARSTIDAKPTATVLGLGQITVENGTTLNLEDQALVAVDTTNRGAWRLASRHLSCRSTTAFLPRLSSAGRLRKHCPANWLSIWVERPRRLNTTGCRSSAELELLVRSRRLSSTISCPKSATSSPSSRRPAASMASSTT